MKLNYEIASSLHPQLNLFEISFLQHEHVPLYKTEWEYFSDIVRHESATRPGKLKNQCNQKDYLP